MKRLLTWLSGAASGIALYRFLTWNRRRAAAALAEPAAPSAPAPDPRAQELRARLEESRALVDERDEFERGETAVDEVDAAPADPDERRRRVHEQGRAAADEMRRSAEP